MTPIQPTLNDLHQEILELRSSLPSADQSNELQTLTHKLQRQQKIWIPVAWFVSIVGIVFSAGMAWAVFVGANATDNEVDEKVKAATSQHNEAALDELHPELVQQVAENSTAIDELQKQTKVVATTQKKLDKRTQYQFEFVRWQAEILEARRQRRAPPKKPKKLDDLETDLMMGNYESP